MSDDEKPRCLLCAAGIGDSSAHFRDTEFPNLDALHTHIEAAHHLYVQRIGETRTEAETRFRAEHPEANGPKCRCPRCWHRRNVAADIISQVIAHVVGDALEKAGVKPTRQAQIDPSLN